MTRRRLLSLLAVPATLLVAAGCGGGGSSKPEAPKVPADAVALVDGTPILKKDFDHVIAIGLASYTARQQPAPKAGTAEFETLKQQALGFLFQRLIITNEAKTRKSEQIRWHLCYWISVVGEADDSESGYSIGR